MSLGSRIALGVVALVFAAFFSLTSIAAVAVAFQEQRDFGMAAAHCGAAVFGWALALACFVKRSHPITLRLIALLILVSASWFVVAEARDAIAGLPHTLLQSLGAWVVFGLPALYVTIFGLYYLGTYVKQAWPWIRWG